MDLYVRPVLPAHHLRPLESPPCPRPPEIHPDHHFRRIIHPNFSFGLLPYDPYRASRSAEQPPQETEHYNRRICNQYRHRKYTDRRESESVTQVVNETSRVQLRSAGYNGSSGFTYSGNTLVPKGYCESEHVIHG